MLTILLASGCFWSKEYHLSKLPGVITTAVGFAGGHVPNPTYVRVCHKTTGHAEVVQVIYDPDRLATEVLLAEFFSLHNFKIDRGCGHGQYRSAIFSLAEDEQLATARRMIDRLREAGLEPQTDVEVVPAFYPAEARHQQYCEARGMAPARKDGREIRALLQS
jgi:methionine-S-sulfoxide reductase